MFETIINQYKSIPNWQIGIEIIIFIFGVLSVYYAKRKYFSVSNWNYLHHIIRIYYV